MKPRLFLKISSLVGYRRPALIASRKKTVKRFRKRRHIRALSRKLRSARGSITSQTSLISQEDSHPQ